MVGEISKTVPPESREKFKLFNKAVQQVSNFIKSPKKKGKEVYVSFLFYDSSSRRFYRAVLIGTEDLYRISEKYYDPKKDESSWYYAHLAVKRKAPVLGINLQDSPLPSEIKSEFLKKNIRTVIATPIINENEVQGVINFFYNEQLDEGTTFTEQIISNCKIVSFFFVQLLENIEFRTIEEKNVQFLRHEIPSILSRSEETISDMKYTKESKNNITKDKLWETLEEFVLSAAEARNLALNIGTSQRWLLEGICLGEKHLIEFPSFINNILEVYEKTNKDFKKFYHPKKIMISCDSVLLRRAIDNIVQNAIKYSLDNHPIIISTKAVNGMYKIVITNSGLCIPKNKRELVFEKYYRIDYQNEKTSGVGLGLYITKEIVRSHGGKIYMRKPRNYDGCAVHMLLPYN